MLCCVLPQKMESQDRGGMIVNKCTTDCVDDYMEFYHQKPAYCVVRGDPVCLVSYTCVAGCIGWPA